ncbi:MAG TPA: DHH family phosphoesterase [Candidatus Paceibacterota bacterium]|nr:DHH family phosphoesterase [Candidatus Paceibacterota bacterium]
MSAKEVVIFYHKHCVDGTASAAVCLRKYPEAKAIPLSFSEKEADLEIAKAAISPSTTVIFVDTTLGLEELVGFGKEVLVIDHHISEKEKVEELVKVNQKLTYIFDNEESGATLAFKYFFPDEILPTFLAYVRDIDLWKKELTPESEWLHQFLSTKRNQPETLLSLLESGADLGNYLSIGKTLTEYVDLEIVHTTQLDPCYLQAGDFRVPAFNITNHQSKAGNILALKYQSAVILYGIMGEQTRMSIRSVEGCRPNAQEVASLFRDGGGHTHAAGATIPTSDFLHLFLV